MLISIFGVWLMASNITMLNPSGIGSHSCNVYFTSGGDLYTSNLSQNFSGHTCDQVAAKINEQIYLTGKK